MRKASVIIQVLIFPGSHGKNFDDVSRPKKQWKKKKSLENKKVNCLHATATIQKKSDIYEGKSSCLDSLRQVGAVLVGV